MYVIYLRNNCARRVLSSILVEILNLLCPRSSTCASLSSSNPTPRTQPVKMRLVTSLAIIAIVNGQIHDTEGEEYLESAMKTFRKPVSPEPNLAQKKIDNRLDRQVPGLSFGKKELAKLYETALKKGQAVKITTGSSGPHLNAAVYELKDDHHDADVPGELDTSDSDASAYYYYYYPRKVFMDELVPKDDPYSHKDADHHVRIVESKPPVEEKKKHKALEPLFMAISGFIGMSVMFVLSMLILPKFGGIKSRGVKDSTEATSILRVIYQAIDGYDCTERLSCEFGKATKAFNMQNNRIFKLLRRIGPAALSKRLYSINKYSNKKHKCAVIQCKDPGANGNVNKKG